MIDDVYLERVATRVDDLERDLSQPETVADKARYRSLVTEHSHIKKLERCCSEFLNLRRGHQEATSLLANEKIDEDLRLLAEGELAELETSLPAAERALKVALLPSDPDDSRNCIVEIRAGTGGDEAGLFAGDLFRMYSRYAEHHGWTCTVLDASDTSLGGYKEVVFTVEGENVYRHLRYESGGHRVQRIPATETSGRIHTSAATVAVFPEAEEIDDIEVQSDELRIDTYRASGAGGQHVNKTDSAVRITHLPSGLVVQSQDERSQHRNKEKAMRVLLARLLDLQRLEEDTRMASTRRHLVGSGDRSQRIRTYNFPQNRVTDHRANLSLYNLDRMMEGELDNLLTPLYEQDIEMQLKEQLDTQTGGVA